MLFFHTKSHQWLSVCPNACVCTCGHTHTPSCLCKEVFWLGQPSAFLSLSGMRLGHVLADYHTSCRTVGLWDDAGQLLACPSTWLSILLLPHPSSPFTAVQGLGLPVWPSPLPPPLPWLLPSESVWQLCQHGDAMGPDRGACCGGREALWGDFGAWLEDATALTKLSWWSEDGAGKGGSLHSGVRGQTLEKEGGSWIVGMAVAKKKKRDGRSGKGRGLCRKVSVPPADSSDQANLIGEAQRSSMAVAPQGSHDWNQGPVLCFYGFDIVKSDLKPIYYWAIQMILLNWLDLFFPSLARDYKACMVSKTLFSLSQYFFY